jgi:hypothetical protein
VLDHLVGLLLRALIAQVTGANPLQVHLIELGGLVANAGLVELTGDDRATLYGALLGLAAQLRSDDRDAALALMRRRGRRAFESEAAMKARSVE